MKKTNIVFILIILFAAVLFSGCHLFNEDELDAPTIHSHSIGEHTDFPNITLWWSWVDGHEIYEVVRSAPDDGQPQFTDVGKWDSDDWYRDTGWNAPSGKLIPGHTYIYKARAHANGPSFGPYSAEYSVYIPAFLPPENFTAVLSTGGDSVILEWDFVEDRESYEIYRSIYSDPYNPNSIGTTTQTLYTDNDDLDPGVTYYYWVAAVRFMST
jgi:hypothetical protein